MSDPLSVLNPSLPDLPAVRVLPARSYFPKATEGMQLLRVDSDQAQALLSLYGAQVLSYAPKLGPTEDPTECLWHTDPAHFTPGLPIRGGIPVCLPWFGNERQPSHGFARVSPWTLSAATVHLGCVYLTFQLQDQDDLNQVRALWPHPFLFRLTVAIGATLSLSLSIQHLGKTAERFSFALHSYFKVPLPLDIDGLGGCLSFDAAQSSPPVIQTGQLAVTGAIDRAFMNVPTLQSIVSAKTVLHIESDAPSAVVWNPGIAGKTVSDIGEHYHDFICLERGCVADNAITLLPQQTHTCWTRITALPPGEAAPTRIFF